MNYRIVGQCIGIGAILFASLGRAAEGPEEIDRLAEKVRAEIQSTVPKSPSQLVFRERRESFIPEEPLFLVPRVAGLYESAYFHRGYSHLGPNRYLPSQNVPTALPGHVWGHFFNPIETTRTQFPSRESEPTRDRAGLGYLGNQDLVASLQTSRPFSLLGQVVVARGPFSDPQGIHQEKVDAAYEWAPDRKSSLRAQLFFSRVQGRDPSWIPSRLLNSGADRFASQGTNSLEASQNILVATEYKNQLSALELEVSGYGGRHDFHAFFDPTFFTRDPMNGDQKEFKEGRFLLGGKAAVSLVEEGRETKMKTSFIAAADVQQLEGAENASRQQAFLASLTEGKAVYRKLGFRLKQDIQWVSWVRTEAGVGVEQIGLSGSYTGLGSRSLSNFNKQSLSISPELGLTLNFDQMFDLKLTTAMENRARDYRTLQDEDPTFTRVVTYEAKLGTRLARKVRSEIAVFGWMWEEDPIYDPFTGAVTRYPKRSNVGIELKTEWEMAAGHKLKASATLQRSLFDSDFEGGREVPSVPGRLLTVEAITRLSEKWSARLGVKHVGSRALSPDGAFNGDGFVLADVGAMYDSPGWAISFGVENLLNTKWNEVEKVVTTQLQNETVSQRDVLIRPGLPIRLVGSASIYF